MSECERYQLLTSQLLDGELTEAEEAELRAHMATCPDCAAMYDAFAEVSEALKAEAAAEPLPAALHEGIMEKVRVAEKAKKTHGAIVRLRPILAAAACLVVLAGTVLALRNSARFGKSESSGAAPALYAAGAAESIQESAVAESAVDDGGQQIMFAMTEDGAAPESAEAEADSYAAPEEPAVGATGGAVNGPSMKEAPKADTATQRETGTAIIVVRVTAQAETGTLTGVVTDAGDQTQFAEGDSVTVLIPAPGEYAPDTLLEVKFSTAEQRQDGAVRALEITEA